MLGALLLAISVGLALGFGTALAILLRVEDRAGFVVAVLVGAAAQIVLITELLSLAGLWKAFPLVVGQLLVLAPLSWWTRRRELRGLPLVAKDVMRQPALRRLLGLARREPLSVAVVSVCLLLVVVELLVSLAIVPNTRDSMAYHLARIVYWMQNDSVMQYANASERQRIFPINAEILQGWTMLLANGDRFAQLIQWVSQLGIVAFVLAAGRDLGFRRRDRTLAACAFLVMPAAVAQASSTQNDMVQAFFAASAMLFLVRTLQGQRHSMALFAIAAGLMVGTKSYGVLLAAALGAAGVVLVGRDLRRLILPAMFAGAAVLVLGFFVYGQNLASGEGFFGSQEQDFYRIHSVKEIPISGSGVWWTWIMPVPVAPESPIWKGLAWVVNETVWKASAWLSGVDDHGYLRINAYRFEDVVGGGLPLLLLLLPALFLALARPRSREDLAYATAAVCGFLFIVLTLRVNYWIARFSLPAAALGAPLIARLFAARVARVMLLVLAVLTTATIGISSDTKSVYERGKKAVLFRDRASQQAAAVPAEDSMVRSVEKIVPSGARLGMAMIDDDWEYPYAGQNFERTLVRLPERAIPPDVFDRYDLDALLIANRYVFREFPLRPVAVSPYKRLILRPREAEDPGTQRP